jgi:hypothetical protein
MQVRPTDEKGNSPFGVMVIIMGNDFVGLCSATHWKRNEVVTNAHCVRRSADVQDYYFVYYDKSHRKTFTQAKSFLYVSPTADRDMARISIEESDSAQWDSLDNSTVQPLKEWLPEKPAETSERVSVWAFDPIPQDSTLGHIYSYGATFNPRHCIAAKRKDMYDFHHLFNKNIRIKNVFPASEKPTDSYLENHMRLDSCSQATVPGNSGSIVTLFQNSSLLVGLLEAFRKHAPVTQQKPSLINLFFGPSIGVVEKDNLGNEVTYLYQGNALIKASSIGTIFTEK